MIGDTVTIIAVDTPQRDGRTHHIFGQIGRQALLARQDLTFLHIGDKPLAISRVTQIDQPMALLGLQGLSHHGQQMPLPLQAASRWEWWGLCGGVLLSYPARHVHPVLHPH
jgi:hypothetical protein